MVTDKNVQMLENSQALLTITIDASSIEDAYKKKLNEYAKTVQLPGFRKGKVPAPVLERKAGEAIREESTFDMIEKAMEEVVKDLPENERPLPFETPVLQDEEKLTPFKPESDLTFSVKYDVSPVFELPQYKGLSFEVPSYEITDKDIDEEIEKLREQNSITRNKDGKAASGDIATVCYAEIDESGEEIASTKRDDFTFTIGSGYNFYKIDDDVIGMEKDEEKVIEKSYTEEDNIPGYAGKSIKLKVKLTNLKVRELPEVDDDFAEDVKEEYKSVAELRAGIRADFEKKAEEKSRSLSTELIASKLVETSSITLPASMVNAQLEQDWRRFIANSGLNDKQIEQFLAIQGSTRESILSQWRPEVEKSLKTQLIFDKIKETENFDIDEEQFEKNCEEQLKSVAEADKDSYRKIIRDDMQYEKVVPFLLESNTFTEGNKLSYKEFMDYTTAKESEEEN